MAAKYICSASISVHILVEVFCSRTSFGQEGPVLSAVSV